MKDMGQSASRDALAPQINEPHQPAVSNSEQGAFTPGPWSYRRTHTLSSTYWYVIVDGEGRGPIIDVGGNDLPGQIAEAKHLVTDESEIEANARLIAAAPDLLKALEQITRYVDSDTDPAIASAAYAAIAKARGQS